MLSPHDQLVNSPQRVAINTIFNNGGVANIFFFNFNPNLQGCSCRYIPMLYSKDPVYPPLDGTVNVPETIEFNWIHNADYPAFVYSEDGSSTHHHITEISNLEFGRACHRAAHSLRPGYSTTATRPTVGFIALTDVLLYQAIVIGMMRANIVVRSLISYNLFSVYIYH